MRALRALRPTARQRRASSSFPRLEVAPRADDGSRAARRPRAAGLIPGVVYGGEAARPRRLVAVCEKALGRELRARRAAVENTVYELNIQGEAGTELVVPRQVQLRAATSDVLSANFLRFSPDLVLRVPLRFVDAGLNQTLRRGAYLHRVRHALGVRCADAASVPEALEVSCAAGGKGYVYHGTDVALPPGVRLATPAHAAHALAVVATGDLRGCGGAPSRPPRRRRRARPLAPARRGDGAPSPGVLRRLEVHVDDVREVDAVHERPAVGLLAGRLGLLGGLAPRRRHRRRRLVRRRRGRRGGRARARARVVRRRLRRSALLPLRRARPRGAGRRFALAGGRRRCARYVTAAAAQKTTTIPPNTFSSGSENVRPMAVQHPAQDAPLVSAAPSTLAGCGRRGGFGRAAAHERAPARSVKCSWRAAARHVSLCWGLLV